MLVDVSYNVGERNILQTVLLSFFFRFYFLNALQSDSNSNRIYVIEDKYVFGPAQKSF